ncbi:norQ [Mytilus edulis]|uniref:NorQ n=1 Tax=Mytilus edulis TaxID=6550 RepID=A0A8S3UF39_MYTED|nr:norQ [Mytilus edulis]
MGYCSSTYNKRICNNMNNATRLPKDTETSLSVDKSSLEYYVLGMWIVYYIVICIMVQRTAKGNTRTLVNELAKFVVTKAAQYAYQRIDTEKLVVIKGPTGTGKSACAYHVALRLKNEHAGTNQVFIIDDCIGKYDLEETDAVAWEKEGPLIQKILSNNDHTKVILTCRTSIWHSDIFDRFELQVFVCDLHTDELRLTVSEKRTICESYLEKSDMKVITDEIINMYSFLPSLCSIFSSEDVGTVENFFTLPVQLIEEEIDKYKMKSPVRYISLAVLAIKQTITKHLSHVNIENEELIKSLFLESGFQILPSKDLL